MTQDRIAKVAMWASSDEVQKWSSAMGRFATDAHKALAPIVCVACDTCPFRNFINMGGCLKDDCPIRQVLHTLTRVVPRTGAAVKEIYRQKYRRSA